MLPNDRFKPLVSDVVERTMRLEASIRRRDLLEAAAAIFVVVALSVFHWRNDYPIIMQIGVAIVILAAIEIVVIMFSTPHRADPPNRDVPLLDFCTAEKTRLDRQVRMLRSATWWYSAPILLGFSVIIFGLLSAVPELPALVFYGFLAAFSASFLGAGIVLYRGHSHAANTKFVPIRDELAELAKSLEDDISESSGT